MRRASLLRAIADCGSYGSGYSCNTANGSCCAVISPSAMYCGESCASMYLCEETGTGTCQDGEYFCVGNPVNCT